MADISLTVPEVGGIPSSAPKVDVLPAYAPYAQALTEVSKMGQETASIATRQQEAAAMNEAINRSSGAAVDMESELNKILTEPLPKQKQVSFERATDDETGAPYAISQIPSMSRSEYLAQQAPDRLGKIRDAYMQAASPWANRILKTHPFLNLDRLYNRTMKQVQIHQKLEYEKEQTGAFLTVVDRAQKAMLTTELPPTRFTDGDEMRAAIGPDGDKDYQASKQWINTAADGLRDTGINAEVVEKLRISSLNKLAQSRALQYATQKPDDWTASRVAGKNEWEGELKDVNTLTALDTHAEGMSNRVSARGEKMAKQLRENTKSMLEAEYLSGTPAAEVRDHVLRYLKAGFIQAEDADHFQAITSKPLDKVVSDQKVRKEVMQRATDPNVKESYLKDIDALADAGVLSVEDMIAAKSHANAIIDRRENRAQQADNRALARSHREYAEVHDALQTEFKGGGLLEQLNPQAQTQNADLKLELAEFSRKNPTGDFINWYRGRRTSALARRDSLYQATVDKLVGNLPIPAAILKPDKQGLFEDASLEAAKKELAAKFGVKNAQEWDAAVVRNPALQNSARTLEDLRKLNAERRSVLTNAAVPMGPAPKEQGGAVTLPGAAR